MPRQRPHGASETVARRGRSAAGPSSSGSSSCFVVLMMVVTGLHWAAMPPSRVETIDPRTLHISGEFVESQSRHDASAPTARRSCAWSRSSTRSSRSASSCRRRCRSRSAARAPTSIHGFVVGTTNANTMLIPGFVATFTTTFRKTGEHLMPCHEYCGTGHEAMWARVQVIPAERVHRQGRHAEKG